MKKAAALILVLVLFTFSLSPAVLAEASPPVFIFDLSCSGAHEVSAATGDIIEITFSILRTDADIAFDSTALQNRIVFDEDFFEFVDASCTRSMGYAGLKKTLAGYKIYMTDMMDMLEPALVFGTFRLKVIGASGAGWVRNGSAKLQRLDKNNDIENAQIICADLCVHLRGPCGDITECTSESAAAVVRNESERAAYLSCLLAAYDESGRMLTAEQFTGDLSVGESVPLSVSAEGIVSAKLFLLDGKSGKPLCSALSKKADG